MTVSRRTLLLAALALTGCESDTRTSTASTPTKTPTPSRILTPGTVQRIAYGPDPSQFGDLFLPANTPKSVIVTLHGGWWDATHGVEITAPIADTLQQWGYAVWNLEYRRLGIGGGWPMTFEDVAAGIDFLGTLDGLDVPAVRIVGYSAGGPLAVWAGSRSDATPGGPPILEVSRVVALAGVLDLSLGSRHQMGGGVIDTFMGGTPEQVPEHFRYGDPTLMVPANCPVVCVHGDQDLIVPLEQSTSYVAAATAAGGDAALMQITGDHGTVIDPSSAPYPGIQDAITQ